MAGRHVLEDETSELRVRVEAPSTVELFEEAGRALAEIMGGGGPPQEGAQAERIAITGRDLTALLVGLLNELIYLAETRGLIFYDVQVDELGEGALAATARGRPPRADGEEARTFVKAATFHGLKIVEGPEGVSATIVLDV
jgi:SHS2 domain-containing protein